MSKHLLANEKSVLKAVEILQNGGLIIFPTDTVYGLAANATNETAIKQIFKIKKRAFNKPLGVLLANFKQIQCWANALPNDAQKLSKLFWPGPMTLVLPAKSSINPLITAGQTTIGLRIPNHPWLLSLLSHFEQGLVTTSANLSNHKSPTSIAELDKTITSQVNLIIDGGICTIGQASTVIDLCQTPYKILRQGTISEKDINKALS
ncbi:MAG: threonylcarbamoyl-AMP synthase [Gammaproteobacteria bacterium RIFCSPHIGHO2_12_FULL_35_23]|nr:MAG: threonylcarbamoyl-AMP synthase [Gammaproteobacteria bacterium RIFCSPHIGHO2_12_FULL_35_23]